MMNMRYSIFLFLSLFYISCQSMPFHSYEKSTEDSKSILHSSKTAEVIKKTTKSKKQKKWEAPLSKLVIEDRPEVQVWVRYFTGRGKDRMKLYLERSHRYLDLMRSILKKAGLPEELIYIAMIESGFSFKAHSRASAVGYWQFIEATGRRYGLKINGFVDERRDPLLSTQAASRYLKDLYDLFGTWYLAMASYNAGEYRVNRAMMKYYTRDFWHLRNKRSLPRETREYIPKFMAAYLIASDPAKYGFTDLSHKKPIKFDSVAVDRPVSLKKVAQSLNLDHSDLKDLNPKYVSDYIPVQKNRVSIIRVPSGYSEKLTQQVVLASFMERPKYSKTYLYYKVRWGDSLYALAARNRTTVNTIARMNGFSSSKKLRTGQVIKLPRVYGAPAKRRRMATLSSPSQKYHKVRKGDSLSSISKKYRVTIAQVKTWNNLKRSVIHPYQILRVKKPSKKDTTNRLHIVRKGETLISISKKYKVPLAALMKHNSLNFKSILRVGRTIRIP